MFYDEDANSPFDDSEGEALQIVIDDGENEAKENKSHSVVQASNQDESTGLDIYADLLNQQHSQEARINQETLNEHAELKVANTELGKCIETMKLENDKLLAKNVILQKNISALYRTAKTQLEWKDKEISELRRRLDDMIFRRQCKFEAKLPHESTRNRNQPDPTMNNRTIKDEQTKVNVCQSTNVDSQSKFAFTPKERDDDDDTDDRMLRLYSKAKKKLNNSKAELANNQIAPKSTEKSKNSLKETGMTDEKKVCKSTRKGMSEKNPGVSFRHMDAVLKHNSPNSSVDDKCQKNSSDLKCRTSPNPNNETDQRKKNSVKNLKHLERKPKAKRVSSEKSDKRHTRLGFTDQVVNESNLKSNKKEMPRTLSAVNYNEGERCVKKNGLVEPSSKSQKILSAKVLKNENNSVNAEKQNTIDSAPLNQSLKRSLNKEVVSECKIGGGIQFLKSKQSPDDEKSNRKSSTGDKLTERKESAVKNLDKNEKSSAKVDSAIIKQQNVIPKVSKSSAYKIGVINGMNENFNFKASDDVRSSSSTRLVQDVKKLQRKNSSVDTASTTRPNKTTANEESSVKNHNTSKSREKMTNYPKVDGEIIKSSIVDNLSDSIHKDESEVQTEDGVPSSSSTKLDVKKLKRKSSNGNKASKVRQDKVVSNDESSVNNSECDGKLEIIESFASDEFSDSMESSIPKGVSELRTEDEVRASSCSKVRHSHEDKSQRKCMIGTKSSEISKSKVNASKNLPKVKNSSGSVGTIVERRFDNSIDESVSKNAPEPEMEDKVRASDGKTGKDSKTTASNRSFDKSEVVAPKNQDKFEISPRNSPPKAVEKLTSRSPVSGKNSLNDPIKNSTSKARSEFKTSKKVLVSSRVKPSSETEKSNVDASKNPDKRPKFSPKVEQRVNKSNTDKNQTMKSSAKHDFRNSSDNMVSNNDPDLKIKQKLLALSSSNVEEKKPDRRTSIGDQTKASSIRSFDKSNVKRETVKRAADNIKTKYSISNSRNEERSDFSSRRKASGYRAYRSSVSLAASRLSNGVSANKLDERHPKLTNFEESRERNEKRVRSGSSDRFHGNLEQSREYESSRRMSSKTSEDLRRSRSNDRFHEFRGNSRERVPSRRMSPKRSDMHSRSRSRERYSCNDSHGRRRDGDMYDAQNRDLKSSYDVRKRTFGDEVWKRDYDESPHRTDSGRYLSPPPPNKRLKTTNMACEKSSTRNCSTMKDVSGKFELEDGEVLSSDEG